MSKARVVAPHSTITLPDGATIAYEVLGSRHLGHRQPLVLVGGMSSRRIDWDRLATSLAEVRPNRYGLRLNKHDPNKRLSLHEKRDIARATLESTFDPTWLANPTNSSRFQWWLERMISGGR
ncbi:hypothetical protein H0H87_009522 [Tephrocybe sp. NHM501043]|nr:hypothetical protein H0H87_009522 [Tephrocybe sp. NHM501043]